MTLEAIATTYLFTCDNGKTLDTLAAEKALDGFNSEYSACGTKVKFTVHNDNDTSKAQKIKGALWYSQKER